MFKHECPHCHEKSISIFQKMITGGMTTGGTKCKNCGKSIVNGKICSIVHTVLYLPTFLYTALILITEMNQGVEHQNYGFIFRMWILVLVLSKVIDGFIPDTERCIMRKFDK